MKSVPPNMDAETDGQASCCNHGSGNKIDDIMVPQIDHRYNKGYDEGRVKGAVQEIKNVLVLFAAVSRLIENRSRGSKKTTLYLFVSS